MGAFTLIFRAELRRRWRSWLALVVLIAVVGGLVLAATAAGRRTASAFPAFVSAHGFDAAVYLTTPARYSFPEVASATRMTGLDTGQPACACPHPINPSDFGVIYLPGGSSRLSKLVSGHMPDPSAPDQVLASYTLAQDYGVHIGSVIRVPLYARSQTNAYNNASGALPKPTGPTVSFHVVGFAATEFEFPSGSTPSYDLYATPAFARTVLPHTAFGYVYAVRLRHGAADLARFSQHVSAAGAEASNEDGLISSVEASIHPQAIGWWILAILAALVGMAVIVQALLRQSAVESTDYPALGALGADRRVLTMLGMARNLGVGILGAIGAVAVAAGLSPIAPLGEARVAELSTGVTLDALVLPLGALAVVVVVVALGSWPAVRAARTGPSLHRAGPARPSVLVGQLAAAGAPPSMVVGVRNALERRSGGANVPLGTALLGTVLAVTALCGTSVFGSSLAHLTATPRLYGDDFQLNFTNPSGGGPDPGVVRSLQHDPAVSGITEGYALEVSIGGRSVGAVALQAVHGPLLLSTVVGHLPDGVGQVGLGAGTMRQVGAHLGSVIPVTVLAPTGGRRTVPFRVVSQITFPVLGGVLSLGSGAAFTVPAYAEAACGSGPGHTACRQDPFAGPTAGGILASVVPGPPRGAAAVSHYLDTYQAITALPVVPTSLVNFGEAVNFPLIFGIMLAVAGGATLLHLLVVSVARRRRETGLLKAIGFVNRQVASAVMWQATTLALIGVVVGTPLGIVLGEVVWRAFATNLGVVPVSVLRAWVAAVLALGVVVIANLLAGTPALAAARARPGALLRTQ